MLRIYLSGNDVHDRVLLAFADGCGGVVVKDWKYEPSDVAVIFGVYKSRIPASFARGEVFRRQRQIKKDVVVLETGYVNRGDGENHHYAAGFNGLNGRADFKNTNSPADRALKLQVEPKPWRQGSDLILCGQVPWDASVDSTDHLKWLKWAAGELKKSGRHVVFRPHPLARHACPPIWGCEYSTGPLSEDLKRAWGVFTFNSNSGVEALLEGVPVWAFDRGSMVWEEASHDFTDPEKPFMRGRDQWLRNLAYCQWTLDEMRKGEAWAHLSR